MRVRPPYLLALWFVVACGGAAKDAAPLSTASSPHGAGSDASSNREGADEDEIANEDAIADGNGGEHAEVEAATENAPPCCVPQGAYDPEHDSYQACLRAGGRAWGTDGCGRTPDGRLIPPPPSAAPN